MDTCEEWNSACIAKDNLIKAISDTVDLDQCKKHCLEFDECKFISFFGPNSFPLSNHCMLLKNCKKMHGCDNCHSINKNCFNSCTNSINGRMANNTLEIIAEVQDETLCSASCQKNVNCKFYTYYTDTHSLFPQLCILQDNEQEPIKDCDQCRSGIPNCQKTSPACQFMVGDSKSPHTSYMFTNTTSPSVMTLDIEAIISGCKLTMVAVGGGTRRSYSQKYAVYIGGFRGKVAVTSFESKSLNYQVIVGSVGQSSSVKTACGKETMIDTEPGDSTEGISGKWSNIVDVSTIHQLKTFSLSPGRSGLDYSPSYSRSEYAHSGGESGVLVDGEGPQSFAYAGQGYGGGAGGYSGIAGSGVVLVEITDP